MGCVCMLVFDGGHLIYYPGSFSAESNALELLGLVFFPQFLFLLKETNL